MNQEGSGHLHSQYFLGVSAGVLILFLILFTIHKEFDELGGIGTTSLPVRRFFFWGFIKILFLF